METNKYLLNLNKEEENKVFSVVKKPKNTFDFLRIDFRKLIKAYSFKVLLNMHTYATKEIFNRTINLELFSEEPMLSYKNQIIECNQMIADKYKKIEGRKYMPVA